MSLKTPQSNEGGSGYVLSNEWQHERERLAALETFRDPLTVRHFEAIGVAPGWRCLEIGGGGGSIALWLASRVGPAGHVVATDLDTKFLDLLRAPNLSVQQHDIVTDELEPQAFDLIHARCVLEHLPARDIALRRMIDALRPNGWLLLEDSDFAGLVQVSGGSDALFERTVEALADFLEAGGFDQRYGRKLGALLRARGLIDVCFDAAGEEWGGQDAVAALYSLTFEQIRDGMVGAGLLTSAEIDEFLSLIAQPEFCAISGLACAAWGRKPA